MARKKSNIGQTYDRAIRYAGQTPRKTLKAKRNQWAVIRDNYKQSRPNEKPPTVYDYARAYKQQAQAIQAIPAEQLGTLTPQDIPTIDFAYEFLESFVNRINTIYQDTLNYIDENKEGTHDSGMLASIAAMKIDEIARQHSALLEEIRNLVNEYGLDATAQAISRNVELDYQIAIQFIPPSSVFILFEETLENILALIPQMDAEAQRLAEQMESDYYGV